MGKCQRFRSWMAKVGRSPQSYPPTLHHVGVPLVAPDAPYPAFVHVHPCHGLGLSAGVWASIMPMTKLPDPKKPLYFALIRLPLSGPPPPSGLRPQNASRGSLDMGGGKVYRMDRGSQTGLSIPLQANALFLRAQNCYLT